MGDYMPIDKTKLTKEMLEKAANCNSADELVALAKRSGIEITKAEAEAYMDELQNVELKDGELKHIAGGKAPGGGDKSIPPESRY
jgi:hypothetical protein